MASEKWKFDAFISHASEDKEKIARPLELELKRRGLSVWFDESQLTLGDSLRRKIDAGLQESAFGIVILSEAFFSKKWTQQELDGLVSRDDGKDKVILPVWHGVDRERVSNFSPTLADKLAASTDRGIQHVANEILRGMKSVPNRSTDRIENAKLQLDQDVHAENLRWLAEHSGVPDETASNSVDRGMAKVCVLCAELVGVAAYKAYHSYGQSLEKNYTHNNCVRDIVESPKYYGVVPKFIDGAVIAYFQGDDAAARGMHAALDVLSAVQRENKARSWHFPQAMSTCIGLDYGEAWLMRFGQSATPDPQGRPIDIAIQLARLGINNQIIATDEAYRSVSEDSAFANHHSVKCSLRGGLHPKTLVSIAPIGEPISRIALPGVGADFPDDVQKRVVSAVEHWNFSQDADMKHEIDLAARELAESMKLYREVLKIDPLNFDANFYLAEHLSLHVRNNVKERDNRLAEASKLLLTATSERPEACFGWKLLSWVRFRQYRQAKSKELAVLNEAIDYACHSLRIANANKDAYGAAIARIYLLIYYYFKFTNSVATEDEKADSVATALRHLADARTTLDAGLSKWLKSQFTTGDALVGLISGSYTEDQAIEKLRDAQKQDSKNRLAAELVVELMDGVDLPLSTSRARHQSTGSRQPDE